MGPFGVPAQSTKVEQGALRVGGKNNTEKREMAWLSGRHPRSSGPQFASSGSDGTPGSQEPWEPPYPMPPGSRPAGAPSPACGCHTGWRRLGSPWSNTLLPSPTELGRPDQCHADSSQCKILIVVKNLIPQQSVHLFIHSFMCFLLEPGCLLLEGPLQQSCLSEVSPAQKKELCSWCRAVPVNVCRMLAHGPATPRVL